MVLRDWRKARMHSTYPGTRMASPIKSASDSADDAGDRIECRVERVDRRPPYDTTRTLGETLAGCAKLLRKR